MKVFLAGHHAHVGVFGKPELKLSSFLKDQGWELTESYVQAEVICAIEVPATRFSRLRVPSGTSQKGLLVIQEPEVVWPANSNSNALALFAQRIEVGRPITGTKWPLIWPVSRQHFDPEQKRSRACVIAGDKLSCIQGELYSLRREVVHFDSRVDLYGQGWRRTFLQRIKDVAYQMVLLAMSGRPLSLKSLNLFFRKPQRYLGPVEDKISTNSTYKVSVVIENSATYMSEKFLEAVVAGSIPVYVGPNPSHFGIPDELYILAEPSLAAISDGITEALAMNYESWALAALAFLESDQVKKEWSLETHWQAIHAALSRLAEANSSGVPG